MITLLPYAFFVLLWTLAQGQGMNPGAAGAPGAAGSDHPTPETSAAGGETVKVSLFAQKLQGICAQDSDMELFNSTCSTSATSIMLHKETSASSLLNLTLPADNNIIKVRTQNRLMLREAINQALLNAEVPSHHPTFAFEILSSVFSIFGSICSAVPSSFLQRVLHLYSFIHYKTAVDRTPYTTKTSQKWISRLINECATKVKPFPVFTDACQEKVIAASNCTSPICTKAEHEFRLMRTDPIVDTVFKSLELVQSVCFPFFNESYRMFHFFHLAIADTFTDDIKIRWANQVENFNFWRRLIGPFFDTHLLNIERCTEGLVSRQKWHFRIQRESMPARIRITSTKRRRV